MADDDGQIGQGPPRWQQVVPSWDRVVTAASHRQTPIDQQEIDAAGATRPSMWSTNEAPSPGA
jgi:hypothetical protein